MPTFRQRGATVEAAQFDPSDPNWGTSPLTENVHMRPVALGAADPYYVIRQGSSETSIEPGDYLVKPQGGPLMAMGAETFRSRFEPVMGGQARLEAAQALAEDVLPLATLVLAGALVEGVSAIVGDLAKMLPPTKTASDLVEEIASSAARVALDEAAALLANRRETI